MPILPISYAKNRGRCTGPVFIAEEVYAFYLNLDKPTNDPAFANFRLDLSQNGNVIAANVGGLTQDLIGGGFYNIYCQFSFPAGIAPGKYKLQIFDTVTLAVKATSSTIEVANTDDALVNTAFVAFRNKYNKFGFRYEQNPHFYTKLRLPLIQINMQQASERKQYRNVSNRRLRNLNSYKDEIITVESYYFNELMHRGIAAMYEHDEIYFNNYFIVPKSTYEIDDNRQSVLTKGTVEAIVDFDVQAPDDAYWPVVVLITNDDIDVLTNDGHQIFVTA